MSTSDSTPPAKTGHPIGFLFFFWGEFAERYSFYGMKAILALYMADELGISKGNTARYMSFFNAAVYLLPLVGGFIADNFFGKYWTIVGFSIPYVLGQFLVGFPNRELFVCSLGLLAMGSGVIKPNISSLMGMTYDQQRPGQNALRTSAFSWFYLAINVGAMIAQVSMPILRTKFGYQAAFMAPAALMAVALVVFALGKRHYAVENVREKVEASPEESAHKWRILGTTALLFAPVMLFWAIFDQSAFTWVFFTQTYTNCDIDLPLFGKQTFDADGLQFFNSMFIIIFVPLSIPLWKYLAAKGIKIRATTKITVGFLLTALCMGIMGYAGSLAGPKRETWRVSTPAADFLLDKPTVTGGADKTADADIAGASISEGEFKFEIAKGAIKNKKLSVTDGTIRIPAGTIVLAGGKVDLAHSTALAPDKSLAAGGIVAVLAKGPTGDEKKLVLDKDDIKSLEPGSEETPIGYGKFDYVPKDQQVTVWWQVLAYLIITFAEILVSITGLELAFVVAPASMKSLITALWLVTVGLANLLINATVTGYYDEMKPGDYFYMLMIAMLAVTFVFLFIAKFFNKMLDEKGKATE